MPRLSKDEYFLAMLELVKQRSTCARRQVGAVITTADGQVLSTGYNGVPRGFPHCTDTPCDGVNDPKGDTHRCMAVHAEVNAVLQCHRRDLADTIYVSCSPCFSCAKMLVNAGIRRVICREPYADTSAVDIFRRAGIEIIVWV